MVDRERAEAATVSVPFTDRTARALVDEAAGSAAEHIAATGAEARLINAAMPIDFAGVQEARPFLIHSGKTDAQRALTCLTQAVYYEAGFEPVEGRRAVAQVVLNRVRHPAFPNSVCGVVYQGANTGVCQFTFVCDGALYRKPAAAAWRQAQEIARAALGGFVEPAVGESTFYHADYVAPRWAPLLAKTAQIGQHIFYRWPGAWGRQAMFTAAYIGEPRDPASLRLSLVNVASSATTQEPAEQLVSGPPVARAPDDVGGLLDTSKGWTLHIPGPEETGSSAAKTIASQETASIAATPTGGASSAAKLASR
jgi:spore germination cell wall hydrolase CwlJ-like protein